MKTKRVYDLFQGPSGPSAQTVNYGRHGKRVWKVAAVSIKQAVFLAAKGIWYDGVTNHTGIIATTGDASDSPWEWAEGLAKQDYHHYANFNG